MKKEKFYSAFGILTAAFSEMEADLRMLISGLAFGNNSVVASAFLDSSQLNENLRILKKLSRQYRDEENHILDIISTIGQIRETRNLFIHGIWHPGSFAESNGLATVTDLKTSYNEEDNAKRSWLHSQTLKFSICDFQKILDSVYEIEEKIEKLCDRLSSDNGIEFTQGGCTITFKPNIFNIEDISSKL